MNTKPKIPKCFIVAGLVSFRRRNARGSNLDSMKASVGQITNTNSAILWAKAKTTTHRKNWMCAMCVLRGWIQQVISHVLFFFFFNENEREHCQMQMSKNQLFLLAFWGIAHLLWFVFLIHKLAYFCYNLINSPNSKGIRTSWTLSFFLEMDWKINKFQIQHQVHGMPWIRDQIDEYNSIMLKIVCYFKTKTI